MDSAGWEGRSVPTCERLKSEVDHELPPHRSDGLAVISIAKLGIDADERDGHNGDR